MSQANHSIMTYGTFGMWGALLAGLQKFFFFTNYTKNLLIFPKRVVKVRTQKSFAAHFEGSHSTLLCRGTPVEKHCQLENSSSEMDGGAGVIKFPILPLWLRYRSAPLQQTWRFLAMICSA